MAIGALSRGTLRNSWIPFTGVSITCFIVVLATILFSEGLELTRAEGEWNYLFSLVSSILTCFLTSGFAFLIFLYNRNPSSVIIGGVLLSVTLFDLFCLFSGFDKSFNLGHLYFGWLLSQALNVFLLFSGVISFGFIKSKSHHATNTNYKLWLFLAYCFLFLGMGLTFQFKNNVARFLNDGFSVYRFELILFSAYLFLALIGFSRFLKRFPSSTLGWAIHFSAIPAAFSCLTMALNNQSFDLYFTVAQSFRLISFLLLFSGVCTYLIQCFKKYRKALNRLGAEVERRIAVEQALVKQENRLALVEKMARLGSWECDLETNELTWSEEMYTILGLDKATYIPSFDNWEGVFLQADVEKVKTVVDNALRNGLPYSISFQIRRPDGSIRYLLGQGHFSSIYNKFINTLLDITELKEANYKLLQSESLLREAEALAHNGSWEWSQEKNAFFWSDELYRIHGLEPESAEVDLRFYLSLIHPDDVQHFVTTLADTQTTLAPFSINYRIIKADGEVRYLSLNGKFKTDFSGNVNKVLGNTQDVTELKRTSMKLERSESIYRTIARNVPDSAVFLFDEKLNLLLTQGPAINSIDPDKRIKDIHSFQSSIFGNEFKPSYKFVEEALAGKENRLEYHVQQRAFKTTYTPVHVSGGEILGVMVVMHDITDLKKAQTSLETKVTELNRSNNDLEQFAYTASHDLQEPLRKIRAFGDRIKVKYSDLLPAEGLDYISRMSNASERMQLLIDDLLTFSKISRPGEELQPLNLEETINQVIQDLEYSIEKKKAFIQVDVRHSLKVIPLQLRQLFQNLFSNSLKFAKEEVPLSLKVTSVTVCGRKHINLLDGKEYCMIEVSDNGIGFDKQFGRKIFTLFYRLHSRTEYEGTGIGLAICKKIVENHNGFIEAEGEENIGATFRIFLPI